MSSHDRVKLGMQPVPKHQSLLATALATKRSDEVNQAKSQTNEVRVEPRPKVRN